MHQQQSTVNTLYYQRTPEGVRGRYQQQRLCYQE
jgi:hypothetical protein